MDLILFPVNDDTFEFFVQSQMIRHPLYNTLAGNLDIELSDGFKKFFKEKEIRDRLKTYRDFHIETIKKKQKIFKEYLDKKDYEGVLFLIEKPYRLDWLNENIELFEDNPKQFYELLKDAYVDTEFPLSGLDKDEIQNLFYYYGNPLLMMDKDEKKFYKKLPKELIIYRGIKIKQNEKVNKDNIGFSFSLDKDRAEWFAKRLLLANDTAYLITAKIEKEKILSVFLNRGEEEVLVDPDFLYDVNIKKIKTPDISERDLFTRSFQQNLWSG